MIIIRAHGLDAHCVAPKETLTSVVCNEKTLHFFWKAGDKSTWEYESPEQARIACEHLSRNFSQETVDVLTPEEAQEVLQQFEVEYELSREGRTVGLSDKWKFPYLREWAKNRRAQEGKS